MQKTTWTKKTLAYSINQRVDQGKLGGTEYIVSLDISDAALKQFQRKWDEYEANQVEREHEFKRLYQAILAGF